MIGSPTNWSHEIDNYQRFGAWDERLGPRPDEAGTRVPHDVLAKYGIATEIEVPRAFRDHNSRPSSNGSNGHATNPDQPLTGDEATPDIEELFHFEPEGAGDNTSEKGNSKSHGDGTVHQRRDGTMGEKPEKGGTDPKPVVFKLVSFDDLTAPSADEYNVKGLFPRRGLVLVWGPPKCGKSFWVFDLVMHVALGREYRRRKVKEGEAAYLVLEGQAGFPKRRDAFRKSFLKPDQKVPLFKLCGATLDLVKDHKKLIADIKEQSAKPAIVVIDTLNRSLVGSESSDEDMAAYLKAANAIEAAFACLVVVIHHCGVNENRPRGHTSMTGAADVQIKVTKDDDGVITANLELAKDLEEGATFLSRLKVVHLGDDPDGDRITSCVIEAVDGDAAPITNEKRKKLSPAAVTALRAIKMAIDEVGTVPPASNHIPAKVRCVTKEQWRDYANRIGICTESGKEAKTAEEAAKMLKEAQRVAFRRASADLIATGQVSAWEDAYWSSKG